MTIDQLAGLAVRSWPVPAGSGPPRAAALIVHGIAEHSGRWERVGRRLAASGIETHAYDLRGFGRSDGPRAFAERWSDVHDDLEHVLGAVRASAGGRPAVVYGHSLGGLIALGHALSPRPGPDLLVLSAPAIRATIPASKRIAVRVLSRLMPRLEVRNELDPASLSRDPEVWERYIADPLCHHRTTTRFGAIALAEQARITREITRRGPPVETLVIHGGADTLVPPAASEPLAALPGVTRRLYPGVRHELHNDPGGEAIVGDVAAWILSRAGTP